MKEPKLLKKSLIKNYMQHHSFEETLHLYGSLRERVAVNMILLKFLHVFS